MIWYYTWEINVIIEMKNTIRSSAGCIALSLCLKFKPYKKVVLTTMNAAMTFVSVNFRRGRKNPRARLRGNRWEFSPLRLRDNRTPSAEQQRHCLAICSQSGNEKRTAAKCVGKWRHPVCVCQMLGQAVRTASESQWLGTLNLRSESFYYSTGLTLLFLWQTLPCCVISATSERACAMVKDQDPIPPVSSTTAPSIRDLTEHRWKVFGSLLFQRKSHRS